MSDYFSFLTLVLFGSTIVTYSSLISVAKPFFFLSVVIYGLNLSFQIFGIYLKRKNPMMICPYCLKKIDLTMSSFCCGHMIRRVSQFWYLAPAAFGIFFLASSGSHLYAHPVDFILPPFSCISLTAFTNFSLGSLLLAGVLT